MLLKLMNFLVNRQYIEMCEWAKAILDKSGGNIDEDSVNVLRVYRDWETDRKSVV